MLSAFTARSIIELRSRDKSKIESVLAYGEYMCLFFFSLFLSPFPSGGCKVAAQNTANIFRCP